MALLTTVMAMLMMVALTAGFTLMTMTESAIAANHRDGIQALYAAEAGIDLAISRLRTTSDWAALVSAGTNTLVAVRLADVVQSIAADERLIITVTVSPDPGGSPDVLVLQSMAHGSGSGTQRHVQVTVRRLPPDASGARAIETVSWR